VAEVVQYFISEPGERDGSVGKALFAAPPDSIRMSGRLEGRDWPFLVFDHKGGELI